MQLESQTLLRELRAASITSLVLLSLKVVWEYLCNMKEDVRVAERLGRKARIKGEAKARVEGENAWIEGEAEAWISREEGLEVEEELRGGGPGPLPAWYPNHGGRRALHGPQASRLSWRREGCLLGELEAARAGNGLGGDGQGQRDLRHEGRHRGAAEEVEGREEGRSYQDHGSSYSKRVRARPQGLDHEAEVLKDLAKLEEARRLHFVQVVARGQEAKDVEGVTNIYK